MILCEECLHKEVCKYKDKPMPEIKEEPFVLACKYANYNIDVECRYADTTRCLAIIGPED